MADKCLRVGDDANVHRFAQVRNVRFRHGHHKCML